MLWLPLQGAAAAVLSVCVQEKDPDMVMMAIENHEDACHKQTTNSTIDHFMANLLCDDYTSCDAYGNTPILLGYTALPLTNNTSAIASFSSGFISFVPEQVQRPPLI